ncbi:hypothetical protein GLOTRDRAFT_116061 [Gloeophyllum trabeum ATCC 11539]|uniref:Uncharacterized protein n=1 Tax=Gloeophyllum trabeum (strain ATCC 11539 / FP-39264 / Madison 617) TaxID=670483 RepID=S7Q8Q7_GLOTA|nr:uncharacterized protein GLOTRDRAFT_116061 [Gloeophyllum trabeum ATCC 11539]EPQ55907.1 hypothetical protein GLOTRDRAFT_116061 [Gloeophyllum trabeum ATCC 11539]
MIMLHMSLLITFLPIFPFHQDRSSRTTSLSNGGALTLRHIIVVFCPQHHPTPSLTLPVLSLVEGLTSTIPPTHFPPFHHLYPYIYGFTEICDKIRPTL